MNFELIPVQNSTMFSKYDPQVTRCAWNSYIFVLIETSKQLSRWKYEQEAQWHYDKFRILLHDAFETKSEAFENQRTAKEETENCQLNFRGLNQIQNESFHRHIVHKI